MLFPAYNRFHSHLEGHEGEVTAGLELWSEAYLGYKVRYRTAKATVFAAPQVGLGTGIWMQHPWPGWGDRDALDTLTVVPNLLVGVEI